MFLFCSRSQAGVAGRFEKLPSKNSPWLIREIRRNEPGSRQAANQRPESQLFQRSGRLRSERAGVGKPWASSVIGRTFPRPSKDPKSRIPSAGRPARWHTGIHGRAVPPATPTGWRRPEGSRIAGLKVCFAFRSYAPKTRRFLGAHAAINQIGASAKRLACVGFE
jgi:hypothetical protein